MKHFMLPRKPILRDDNQAESAACSSIRANVTPKKSKSSKENSDPNSISPAPASHFPAKVKNPLPPRPPPVKFRKLNGDCGVIGEAVESGVARAVSDSGVQVIVRMRPPNKTEEEGEMIVQKLSNDTLSIGSHNFTFDSIADTEASQADIFQLVGAPLVENCLAGFNSSVFAYGQTGSGKTYTVWGPANALLEKSISSDQHGLTPRVFQRLFERVDEEQIKHCEKQLVYQCRCSFLEIYNEQITDLLDPTQKALQIREDVKAGVYVENLTEEYVSSMADVIQLLVKGLTNRRTGATSVNAESSRSHSVFTCVVESKCKSLEDGLSYFKTSRINLVDLAGSERQKLTGAAGERLKEAGNINRSLSQLGNLINILAEVSQTGKQRHIPYRDSKLTFLLQESLGGNAKLAMMCAISPVQSCKSETFSTLRFAQRAKAIKNKAIVNEETKDDVNVLKEVIRQLKDELLRMKANGNQTDQNDFSSRWNARRSLNLLKFSLNRPLVADDDSDEEMEIVEEAEGIIQQAELRVAEKETTPERQISLDTDVSMEEVSEEDNKDELVIAEHDKHQNILKTDGSDLHISVNGNSIIDLMSSPKTFLNDSYGLSTKVESPSPSVRNSICNRGEPEEIHASPSPSPHVINVVPSDISPVLLKSPTPSVSPRALLSSSRKSFKSSSLATTQRSISDATLEFDTTPVPHLKPSNSICLGSGSSKRSEISSAPTAYLAASLHRGLEIISSNRRSAALRSFRFSCKHSDITAMTPAPKADAGVQTSPEDFEVSEDELRAYLCSKCKTTGSQDEMKDTNQNANMQLVQISGSESCSMNQVPKAVEKVLAGAIRREMALEELCAQQNSEIMQLNRLVQQYKHERECNAVISQTREDKIARLESLMDGVLESEDFKDEELSALTYEHEILKENYKNHPDVLRINIELRRVQDELERYKNFCDMGERDVLVEEIHDLRSQLQSYTDSSLKSSKRGKRHMLQLTYSSEPRGEAPPLSVVSESVEDIVEKRLEEADNKWVEAESEWITLVEELRLELESTRALIQNQKQELQMEKKCADELKEAMQLAMEGQARMIEQYSELQEKHIHLLMRHRKVQDGIEDVKKAAVKAGVRGTGLKFINALAAEVSSLKVEREKERCYFRDENKGLQAQLRDTAEAVQAAGELLVRLKEAEEAIAAAEKRAKDSEQETERACKQIDSLKRNHEKEISALNQLIADSHHPKEAAPPIFDNDSRMASYDACETHKEIDSLKNNPEKEISALNQLISDSHHPKKAALPMFDDDSRIASYDAYEVHSTDDQSWREEFKSFYHAEEEELSKLGEPSSWFSGYDRCNV